jgi:aryl-alcohol dehydrogenase-like predicted oxidoreductase
MRDFCRSLGLGTAQWGMKYGISNQTGIPTIKEICGILDFAYAQGISILDTARSYGESENQIGSATSITGLPFRVITKLDPKVHLSGDSWREVRKKAIASVNASLSALGVDRLDTLLLHRPENRFSFNGDLWNVLLEEKEKGRIRNLGISVVDPNDALPGLSDSSVELIQVPSNLLDNRLVNNQFFEIAAKKSVEVHVRSIYLQGLALKTSRCLPLYFNEAIKSFRMIESLSEELGVPPMILWLNHALQIKCSTVLLGCETLGQLRDNLKQIDLLNELQLEFPYQNLPTIPENLVDPTCWPSTI